jgi:hypothetical protein
MAKRILIELEDNALRCMEASIESGRIRLQRLVNVSLNSDTTLVEQVDAIKRGLTQAGIARGDVDFIVSRRQVEMREIGVPPVPNNELPELLKFSARNEFASVNDQWKLDFVPLSDVEDQPRHVLAAALPPQWKAGIDEICKQYGLRLKRILLRPFCILSAAENHLTGNEPLLIVNRSQQNLEMLLVSNRLLRANRSVLLSGHEPRELQQEIRGELTRTLMAGAKVLEGRSVEHVLFMGSTEEWREMVELLEEGITAKVVSPAEAFGNKVQIQTDASAEAKDLAALVGAAHSLEQTAIRQIDFANPRRKIVKKVDRRKLQLWGGVAAAALLILAVMGWMMLSSAKSRIDSLTRQLNEVKQITEPTDGRPGVTQIVGEVGIVDEWARDSVNWLEEMSAVSSRSLSADEIMLSQVDFNIRSEGMEVLLVGNAASTVSNTDFKGVLIERPFEIISTSIKSDPQNSEYPQAIEMRVRRQVSADERKREIQARARDYLREQTPAAESSPADETTAPPTK